MSRNRSYELIARMFDGAEEGLTRGGSGRMRLPKTCAQAFGRCGVPCEDSNDLEYTPTSYGSPPRGFGLAAKRVVQHAARGVVRPHRQRSRCDCRARVDA